jgi:hypothetical protein
VVFDNPILDNIGGQYPVYQFPATIPNKSGRHLLYTMWVRHDSLENFYGCSDVWIGNGPQPTPTPAPACTAPEWVSGTMSVGGAVVSHNNKQWVAKWTNSDEPSTTGTSSAWKLQANCTFSGGSGTPLPTATFVIPPTSTAGPSPTPCANCGPTNTPIPPTATLPAQFTPTRTRTATAGPSATRTRTSTTGPSPTRSPGTPTSGPSATRTNTPVITNTPTTTVGACSPVTSIITIPFTFDGAGTFCWQAASLGAFINSWNTNSVSVNGMNATNVYVASGSYPAKINNNYYVSYNSAVAWGHFEAKP